ncbi:hypothetical protein AYK24_01670 [Thermoplasmatales archaeon SG8-52-4]|nr:MAG: hypothetical protein AYK24_01670 [Thermoplasmatales archaeon SG8-52-4]
MNQFFILLMPKLLFEYARLLRVSGLGAFSIGPIFGALSLINIGVKINFIDIAVLLFITVISNVYGFVLNDYGDIEVDRLSKEPVKRPLVTGVISKKIAILICILSIAIVYISIFVYFYRNHNSFFIGVLYCTLALILVYIYNMHGKKIIGSDSFIALSGAIAILFGAYMISPDGNLSIFTWSFFILEFSQYFFGNAVVGGIKDADHDYLRNVKNIALTSGVKVTDDNKIFIPLSFKAFGMGLRFIFAIGAFIPIFYGVQYKMWEMLLLTVFVIGLLLISAKVLSIKTMEHKDKLIKLGGLMGILRMSIIPIMLIPLIGPLYSFILLIFPVLWYIIFTPLTGKKLFRHLT